VLCVVLCIVSGGFVLDCIWNYSVLQFLLRSVWCSVQCVVGLCWTVFGITMSWCFFVYSVLLCTLSGGFVLDCIWNYNVLQFVLCIVW